MNARAMLEQAVAENASDIFLVAGRPLSLRKNGALSLENEERLLPDDTAAFLKEIYELADNRDIKPLLDHGDDDFSFAIPGVSRFRVSAYKQRGTLSAVIRVITFRLPDYHMLGIPDAIINLGLGGKGMTLITGPAGSGKSTTLACIIDQINQTQEKHIITLEDPLEFLHRHNKSIVSQREIHVDTDSYVAALRAALRQSPDVILLGEMRDYENDPCGNDGCRNRTSALFHTAYDRCCEHHRPYHRCISAKPAAPDRRTAFHGVKCRGISAADPYRRRRCGSGI